MEADYRLMATWLVPALAHLLAGLAKRAGPAAQTAAQAQIAGIARSLRKTARKPKSR